MRAKATPPDRFREVLTLVEAGFDPLAAYAVVDIRHAIVGRRCPAMKRHRLGMACACWKVKGRRIWRYFGPWGTEAAAAKYRAFVRTWPAPLAEPHPRGSWPALRILEHDGQAQTVERWAAQTGIKATTIRYRITRLGWSVEQALTTATRPTRQPTDLKSV